MLCRNLVLIAAVFVVPCHALAVDDLCLYAQPSTDYCSCAYLIPGTVGHHVVIMDVTNATGGDTDHYTNAGHTVWFEVTPAVSGPMTISTCHPATRYDTVLEVYSGGDWLCLGMTLVDYVDDTADPECEIDCEGRASSLTIDATAGTLYRFVVGSYNNNSAGCDLCLGVIVTIRPVCGEPPRNLAWQLAQEMDGSFGIRDAYVDVADAFVLDEEPQPGCVTSDVGHTVWFKTTPTVDGIVWFTTCHPRTEYDTVLNAVAIGDHPSIPGEKVFDSIACNDDFDHPDCHNACGGPNDRRGSSVFFDVGVGGEVYFQVGSYDGNSSGCELCLGVSLRITCHGDLDFDNVVNLADLAQLLRFYGMTSGATYLEGDIDLDGDVDLADLAELLQAYGGPC